MAAVVIALMGRDLLDHEIDNAEVKRAEDGERHRIMRTETRSRTKSRISAAPTEGTKGNKSPSKHKLRILYCAQRSNKRLGPI